MPKALLIGIDGLTIRRLDDMDAPTLKGLRDSSAFARSQVYPPGDDVTQTVSGPGWSSIVTGTWPTKHGVHDNGFEAHRLVDHPDVFAAAKLARPELTTFCYACWPPVTEIIVGAGVDHGGGATTDDDWAGADVKNVDAVSSLLASEEPDIGFLYFGAVDKAGHMFGAAAPEYRSAIETVDRQVQSVLATIESRPSYAGEDWLIVVATDHGHRPEGGHGEFSDDERTVFVMMAGDSVNGADVGTIQLVDIAPTLLTHLGIAPAPELDGRSLLHSSH